MKNTVVAEYRNNLVGKEFETNNYGKCTAEKYKDFISHKLYEALCKYEVEITD